MLIEIIFYFYHIGMVTDRREVIVAMMASTQHSALTIHVST